MTRDRHACAHAPGGRRSGAITAARWRRASARNHHRALSAVCAAACARRYQGEDLEDLVQVANVGLIKAVDRCGRAQRDVRRLRPAHDPRRDPPLLPRRDPRAIREERRTARVASPSTRRSAGVRPRGPDAGDRRVSDLTPSEVAEAERVGSPIARRRSTRRTGRRTVTRSRLTMCSPATARRRSRPRCPWGSCRAPRVAARPDRGSAAARLRPHPDRDRGPRRRVPDADLPDSPRQQRGRGRRVRADRRHWLSHCANAVNGAALTAMPLPARTRRPR